MGGKKDSNKERNIKVHPILKSSAEIDLTRCSLHEILG